MALGLATATALDMAKTEAMDEALAMARGLVCHYHGNGLGNELEWPCTP